MGERTVLIPRCGKCAAGKHTRCEHPRHVEGSGDGSVATCCCAVRQESANGGGQTDG